MPVKADRYMKAAVEEDEGQEKPVVYRNREHQNREHKTENTKTENTGTEECRYSR